MMDPMGDIGGGTVDPTSPTTIENSTGTILKSNEIVDPFIIQLNLSRIERIRSIMGISSGCIAGILGLTGMEGLGTCSFLFHRTKGYIYTVNVYSHMKRFMKH
jgi:hypothetical protein